MRAFMRAFVGLIHIMNRYRDYCRKEFTNNTHGNLLQAEGPQRKITQATKQLSYEQNKSFLQV